MNTLADSNLFIWIERWFFLIIPQPFPNSIKYQNGTEIERSITRSRDNSFCGNCVLSQKACDWYIDLQLVHKICHDSFQVHNWLAICVVLYAFTSFLWFLLNYLPHLYQLLACGTQSWRSYPLTGNVGLFGAWALPLPFSLVYVTLTMLVVVHLCVHAVRVDGEDLEWWGWFALEHHCSQYSTVCGPSPHKGHLWPTVASSWLA